MLSLNGALLGSRRRPLCPELGLRTRSLCSAQCRARNVLLCLHADARDTFALRARCTVLERLVAPAPHRAALAEAGLLDADTLRALAAVTANGAVGESLVRHPFAARTDAGLVDALALRALTAVTANGAVRLRATEEQIAAITRAGGVLGFRYVVVVIVITVVVAVIKINVGIVQRFV